MARTYFVTIGMVDDRGQETSCRLTYDTQDQLCGALKMLRTLLLVEGVDDVCDRLMRVASSELLAVSGK